MHRAAHRLLLRAGAGHAPLLPLRQRQGEREREQAGSVGCVAITIMGKVGRVGNERNWRAKGLY